MALFHQHEHRPRGSAASQSAGANGQRRIEAPAPDGRQEEVVGVIPVHAQYQRGERVWGGRCRDNRMPPHTPPPRRRRRRRRRHLRWTMETTTRRAGGGGCGRGQGSRDSRLWRSSATRATRASRRNPAGGCRPAAPGGGGARARAALPRRRSTRHFSDSIVWMGEQHPSLTSGVRGAPVGPDVSLAGGGGDGARRSISASAHLRVGGTLPQTTISRGAGAEEGCRRAEGARPAQTA